METFYVFHRSGKNDSPCGNNFIFTQAIGQESYTYYISSNWWNC